MPKRVVAGVYVIRQVGTDRSYVGSSSHIHKRWGEHRSALRTGRHHSRFLQRAWDAHGAAAFEWAVLEEIAEPTYAALFAREQHYIDALNSCFNGRPDARTFLNARHRPESLALLRKRAQERMCDPSAAYRAYWERMRGGTHDSCSDETKAKIALANRVANGGKPWSEARRAAQEAKRLRGLSARQLAAYDTKRGKQHTAEHKAKIGAGVRKYLGEHDGMMGAVHPAASGVARVPIPASPSVEPGAYAQAPLFGPPRDA